MKRIVILSCFLWTTITIVSCTTDEIAPSTTSATAQILAVDGNSLGGNSSGQTPTTPPKK